MQATLMGIKNKTDEDQILMYDGRSIVFKPGEVRLLQSEAGLHAEKQVIVRQPRDKDGKRENRLVGIQPFESIPLDEAVKVATMEEEPQLVAARLKAQEKNRERATLTSEIVAELKKSGWKAPSIERKEAKK